MCSSQAFYQLGFNNTDTRAMENYLFYLKKFCYPTFSNLKNQAADRGSVLALFIQWIIFLNGPFPASFRIYFSLGALITIDIGTHDIN